MDYNGGRTKDTIIEWLNKKTGPVSAEVDCAAMEAKTAEATLALSYFGAAEGDLWDNYMKSARNPMISEKYQFYHTSDADCASKFGATAPGVAISRRFDESPLAYSGAAANDREMSKWLRDAAIPSQNLVNGYWGNKVFEEKNPAIILFHGNRRSSIAYNFNKAREEVGDDIIFLMNDMTSNWGLDWN